MAFSCHLTPVIPTSLSLLPAPTAQAFLFQENVKSSICLGFCVRWSPSPPFPESPLDWFNPSTTVMKSLTEAILECGDPERNLYQEWSHEGEKAYAGSQSPSTVPDSRGKARAAETEAAGRHIHSQEASATQACCGSALLHVHSAGSKVGNVATQSGQLPPPQLMKSRRFRKACPEAQLPGNSRSVNLAILSGTPLYLRSHKHILVY